MKRSKSYTWLSGLLRPKPEEEWGAAWVRAEVVQNDSEDVVRMSSLGRETSWGRKMAFGILSLLVVLLVALSVPVDGTAEVMSHVMAHYGKSLEECRKETGLSPEILEEFQHFWKDDFEVVHRELGCTIICMSNKFSLLQDDTRIHHLSVDEYIRTFPQGDILSEQLVNLIHECEKQYDDIEDDCDRVVKVSACFKDESKKAGIAPEVAMIEAVMEQY